MTNDSAPRGGSAARRGFVAADSEPDQSPLGGRRGARHAAHPTARDFAGAMGWTLASTVLPGSGLWPTRWRRWGAGLAGVLLVGAVLLAVGVLADPGRARSLLLNPTVLGALTVAMVAVGVLWVSNILVSHLLVRPHRLTGVQRALGSVSVSLLSMLVAVPMFVGARYVHDSADLVTTVFEKTTQRRSQTRVSLDPSQRDDFWKQKPRLNILLVGADSNRARDANGEGIRTDTVILASIDTATGNTVMVQLPRNMARAQFPAGSALAERYPQGFYNGNGDDPERMLNAIWKNVPAENPDLFASTDYAGADALKLAVGASTGLMPDYFVMINIDGIQRLIDAMGGVTVNINNRLPIGGYDVGPPLGYLEPGPNQLLTGYQAMWYARSRHGSESGDFDRMARQTCLVNAVIAQADPATMLTKYEAIAASAKGIIMTDIPQEVLAPIVDLALRVKDARITRVLFVHNKDGFLTYRPDFAMMKARIDAAVRRSIGGAPTAGATAGPTASTTTSGAGTTASRPASSQVPGSSGTGGTPVTVPSVDTQEVKDACAYRPESPSPTPAG